MNNQFLSGLKAGLSIGIGYFPVALTFGLLAKTAGLTLIETAAMSIFVFAGAAQYMSLSMISLKVEPTLIVLNTFVVNIRHFLMTASLNEKMQPAPKWVKAFYGFFITDETFSVIATQKEKKVTTAFAIGTALIAYGSWVIFTPVGYVIGANLPEFLQAAMGIALYAMFIGLLMPAMKESRKVIMLAAVAAATNGLIYYLELMPKGWDILFSTLFSAILIEIIYTRKRNKEPIAQKEAD